MTGRRDSPWYSTLGPFRQASPGDWARFVDQMLSALSAITD
jgi:hypothetical protein